jgi:glycosyltransferase involved in cell wall biosynthesis
VKIGFDGRFIRSRQTGNGMFSQNLVEGLSRLDAENEYTIYLVENNPFIRKDNFFLKQMPSPHANSHLRFLFTFPLELFRNPVDIFHAIYTIPMIPLKTSVKTVLSLIEFAWFTNPEDFPASRLFLYQIRLMTRQSIHRADRIITPTWLGRDQLLEYFNLPEEKVDVVPIGFNERFLEKCETEEVNRVKQKHAIKGEYILSVGDLHPRKNLMRIIDAFNMLKESRRIPHQLVIVGKALWQAEEIYRKASSSSSCESIIFTGYVSFEELRALYQGADLFVFPSLNEGFGLPVHEAMASCVPAIVSNRGALPEVAGNAALVVDPLNTEEIGDAMYRILESPDIRNQLIKKGLEQIQGFSWDESCQKTLRVYNEL